MFYLDIIKKDKLKFNLKSIWENIKFCYKKFFNKIDIQYLGDKSKVYGTNVDNLSLKIKVNIYNVNNNVIKKLDKILNVILEKNVYLSNELKENIDTKYMSLNEYFEYKGIKILDGNIIFKIMFLDILSKISELTNLNKKELRIGVFISDINQDFLYNLEKMVYEYKEVIIITNTENRLEKLKSKLYLESGIILNINNKSLFLKSDIVVNLGGIRNEYSGNEFIIGKCIYVNYDKYFSGIKILDGIEINDFLLDLKNIINEKYYEDYFENLKNYNINEVYQSLIIKNTRIENILNEIKKDDISIKQFIGKNGVINKNEFIGFGKYINSNRRMNLVRKK